jgi:diguanylate cyclase (GGDEF)-like protein/PAS domain S-box-containing protein
MNEARRRSEARFKALVLHASDMIAVIESDGAVRYCSPAVHRLAGLIESDLVGKLLLDIVVPQDRERVSAGIGAVLRRSGLADPIEFRVRHRDGSIRAAEALLNNLQDDPAVGGIVATIRDVTERKAFEDHLAHQALHDALTGLPNRALVLDRLNHALARASRSGKTIGVLFLDLDRFKLINDSHGHAVGDQVLTLLADRLTSAMRPSDTIARFGGDEFVALCENLADEREVSEVATRMADAVRDPFLVDGQELFLTGSVGIAVSGRGETAEELLRNADAAMYRAKELGRAQHAIFDDAMRSRAMTRLQTEGALHRAIDSDGFFLHFQPKISLTDGRLVGAEALVRMMDPEVGMIPPSEFIDVAEDTGLIVPIGEIVLAEAARVARDWFIRTGRPVPVSVNISPRQLAQPTLPDAVERILRETETPPELLILEITENLLMQDAQLASQTLHRLREIGVRVSIDDFGTGHSSLGYLREFPIDELKIDRSFVKAMDEDDRSVTIVGSVVGLAHAMGLSVVAEGVETAAQLAELRRLGCDIAQGFYFSHPRPAETMDELLSPEVVWGSPRTAGQTA